MNSHFGSVFSIGKRKTSTELSTAYPLHLVSSESSFENANKNIYENPDSLNIRANIHAKQVEILNDYYDMGFIASIADNLFVLSSPIKSLISHTKAYADEKYNADLQTVRNNFEKNVKASKKLDKKVNYRKLLFDSIRKIYPEFCYNVEGKIEPEQFNLYHKEKNALRRVISPSPSSSIDEFSSEILLKYQDRLADLIDTPQFSEACSIEDQFVISEIDTFIKLLSSMPKEEQRPFRKKKIKIGEENVSTLELAEKLKSERIARLEKYSEIQKLYRKLEKHPYIRLELTQKDDESR